MRVAYILAFLAFVSALAEMLQWLSVCLIGFVVDERWMIYEILPV